MLKILGMLLLAPFILLSSNVLADAPPAQDKVSAALPSAAPAQQPNLADIIPLAADLHSRLTVLEGEIKAMPDVASIEKDFSATRATLEYISTQLSRLKEAESGNYTLYAKLRQRLESEEAILRGTSKPLADAISALDKRGNEWRAERVRWSQWQSTLIDTESSNQLRSAFSRAMSTIDTAQNLITKHVEILLTAQGGSADTKLGMDTLKADVNALIADLRQESLLGKYPPMYSASYFSQFRTEPWSAAWDELKLLSWPDKRFPARHGLALSLQFLLFVGILAVIYRQRQTLKELEHWRFVAENPISTALFICALILGFQLRIWEAPDTLVLPNTIVGAVACVRLLFSVLQQPRLKQAALGIMIGYVITKLLVMSGLPVPLFRLYMFMAAGLALMFCLRWAREISNSDEAQHYAWVLRLIALLYIVILIAQFLGNAGVASYLFLASLTTMAIILPIKLFIYMIHGSLHWAFFSSPIWQVKLMRNDAEDHVRKSSFLLGAAIVVFILLPAILTAWGVFDSYPDAVSGLLAPGFNIGSQRISVGLVVAAVGTLYGSLLAASMAPKILLDEHFAGRNMERGARLSAGRLLQYFMVLVGFLVTLSIFGLNWTNLAIVLSAFGVGIGFGLQSIVNNFVSGLILLFERPLREGDTIELGQGRVHIKKIGLRATHVQTFEQADVIIPNADLVTNPVTNWTLGNRQVRLSIPVGVAYGSDIRLVGETLLSCAKGHEAVLKSPAPEVLLMGLGESSVDFELRIWIQDADSRVGVRSQLYQEILQRFAESKIEIPFPQRDLHLRSVDVSIPGGALQPIK